MTLIGAGAADECAGNLPNRTVLKRGKTKCWSSGKVTAVHSIRGYH